MGQKNVQKVADVIYGWSKIDHPTDRPTKPHANGQKLTMNFRKFFISFVFISPGISYSSYKFIQHKHWQFSCKWASCNSYRYFSKIVLLFAKHSRIYGLLHLFWAGFCYSLDCMVNKLSRWENGVPFWFWINIWLTLIDLMNLFNTRLFWNSVHLMILSTAKL